MTALCETAGRPARLALKAAAIARQSEQGDVTNWQHKQCSAGFSGSHPPGAVAQHSRPFVPTLKLDDRLGTSG